MIRVLKRKRHKYVEELSKFFPRVTILNESFMNPHPQETWTCLHFPRGIVCESRNIRSLVDDEKAASFAIRNDFSTRMRKVKRSEKWAFYVTHEEFFESGRSWRQKLLLWWNEWKKFSRSNSRGETFKQMWSLIDIYKFLGAFKCWLTLWKVFLEKSERSKKLKVLKKKFFSFKWLYWDEQKALLEA